LNNTPEYRAYLCSPKWRLLRWLKLMQVGFKCQHCGAIRRLDAHHLTYDRFGHERLADIEILCRDKCHPLADEARRRAKAIDTFMRKIAGNDWRSQITDSEAAARFDGWLKGKK